MMRFDRIPGADLPLFVVILTGCSRGLTQAEQRYNAGIEHQEKGQLEESIAEYGEAIRLDHQYALADYNRGVADAGLGQLERANEGYDEATRLDPRRESEWRMRTPL